MKQFLVYWLIALCFIPVVAFPVSYSVIKIGSNGELDMSFNFSGGGTATGEGGTYCTSTSVTVTGTSISGTCSGEMDALDCDHSYTGSVEAKLEITWTFNDGSDPQTVPLEPVSSGVDQPWTLSPTGTLSPPGGIWWNIAGIEVKLTHSLDGVEERDEDNQFVQSFNESDEAVLNTEDGNLDKPKDSKPLYSAFGSSFTVDMLNGVLNESSTDLGFSFYGNNINISRTYNSPDTPFVDQRITDSYAEYGNDTINLGAMWSMNVGQMIIMEDAGFRLEDGAGNSLGFPQDEGGFGVPADRVVDIVYDSENHLVTQTEDSGLQKTFTRINTNYRLKEIEDLNGNVTYFYYYYGPDGMTAKDTAYYSNMPAGSYLREASDYNPAQPPYSDETYRKMSGKLCAIKVKPSGVADADARWVFFYHKIDNCVRMEDDAGGALPNIREVVRLGAIVALGSPYNKEIYYDYSDAAFSSNNDVDGYGNLTQVQYKTSTSTSDTHYEYFYNTDWTGDEPGVKAFMVAKKNKEGDRFVDFDYDYDQTGDLTSMTKHEDTNFSNDRVTEFYYDEEVDETYISESVTLFDDYLGGQMGLKKELGRSGEQEKITIYAYDQEKKKINVLATQLTESLPTDNDGYAYTRYTYNDDSGYLIAKSISGVKTVVYEYDMQEATVGTAEYRRIRVGNLVSVTELAGSQIIDWSGDGDNSYNPSNLRPGLPSLPEMSTFWNYNYGTSYSNGQKKIMCVYQDDWGTHPNYQRLEKIGRFPEGDEGEEVFEREIEFYYQYNITGLDDTFNRIGKRVSCNLYTVADPDNVTLSTMWQSAGVMHELYERNYRNDVGQIIKNYSFEALAASSAFPDESTDCAWILSGTDYNTSGNAMGYPSQTWLKWEDIPIDWDTEDSETTKDIRGRMDGYNSWGTAANTYDAKDTKTETSYTPDDWQPTNITTNVAVNTAVSYYTETDYNLDMLEQASAMENKNNNFASSEDEVNSSKQYNFLGELVFVTKERGPSDTLSTDTVYDALGGVKMDEDPNGNHAYTEYNPAGKPKRTIAYDGTEIEANKVETQTYYDKLGRPIAIIDPKGNKSVKYYDIYGNLVLEGTAPVDGIRTWHAHNYDKWGNVIEDRSFAWNAELSTPAYELVAQKQYMYDQLNRLVMTKTTLNATEAAYTYTPYDEFGNQVLAIDSEGGWIRSFYDAFGRVVKTTDRVNDSGNVAQNTYDANSNLTGALSIADGNTSAGILTTTTYDALNRPVTVTVSAPGEDSLVSTRTYNSLGQVIRAVDPEGAPTLTVRDFLGNVTSTKRRVK